MIILQREKEKKNNEKDEGQFSIIGKEGREAYNSLIERKGSIGVNVGLSPAATLLRHLDTNEFDMTSAKTLPRRSMHMSNNGCGGALDLQDKSLLESATHHANVAGQECIVPLQQAPRPMTLPTRGATHRVRRAEQLTNLTKNNDENFNCDNKSPSSDVVTAGITVAAACESPSYMTNTFYKFPDNVDATTPTGGTKEAPTSPAEPNAIPLPPRDGKKQVKTNAKRHVRKFPLIIPANGLQRTLNKVLDTDDSGSQVALNGTGGGTNGSHGIEIVASLRSMNTMKQREASASYENMPAINANMKKVAASQSLRRSSDGHTYQNLDKLNTAADAAGLTDTASLQFESILEADSNKCHVLQSPDVTDGFYNFSIQKEHYNKSKEVEFNANKMCGLYVNEDELRNLDIERNLQHSTTNIVATVSMPTTAVASTVAEAAATSVPNCSTNSIKEILRSDPVQIESQESPSKNSQSVDNELAGNALFKKVRESVNMAMNKSSTVTTTTTTTEVQPMTKGTSIKKNTSENAPTTTSSLSITVSTITTTATAITTPTVAKEKVQTEAEYFAEKAAHLANSNSVSCEDLLEFSDKKPKGCERGVDSDEVRIMTKVLGKDSVPTRCLSALEFINWDVHKAIKLIKLQNILTANTLSLAEAFEALDKYEWDLHMTALKLKGISTR